MKKRNLLLSASLITLVLGISVSSVSAELQYVEVEKGERQAVHSNIIRERAKANAQANLNYDYVYNNAGVSYQVLLGQQISQLASMTSSLANQIARQANSDPAYGPQLSIAPVVNSSTHVTNIYGPTGVNVKTVRTLLNYRLMIAGNPNIKVGKIHDKDKYVLVELVTLNGSLVGKYQVSKQNGQWTTNQR